MKLTELQVSKSAFEEIRAALDKAGYHTPEVARIALTGFAIVPIPEKPSALRLALNEGLKKDGTATSE